MNIRDNPAELNVLQVGYVFKCKRQYYVIADFITDHIGRVYSVVVRNLRTGRVSQRTADYPRKTWILVGKRYKLKG